MVALRDLPSFAPRRHRLYTQLAAQNTGSHEAECVWLFPDARLSPSQTPLQYVLSNGTRSIHTSLSTSSRETKFEYTRAVGLRAQNLHDGAPPLVVFDITGNVGKKDDIVTVAKKEHAQKKLAATIRRHKPDGTFEDLHIHDLCTIK